MRKTKWELKMNSAREMRKQGAGLLYDRVELLIACYEDEEFRAWHAENGTNEVDFLDEEMNDTAVGFLAFRSVFAAYPQRDQWINHNIRELIALTMEAEAESRKRECDTKRTSWKERALAAEAECERLRGEKAELEKALDIVAGAKCK
jgi:hypothetical protein